MFLQGLVSYQSVVWNRIIRDKVFRNGPSKICGRQTLKYLKGYDLLKHSWILCPIYSWCLFCKLFYLQKRFALIFLPSGIYCLSINRLYNPATTCLFNVNNRNTRTLYEICSKITNSKDISDVTDVVLIALLLTLSRLHTLFWCFHCWLWTSNAGWESKFSSSFLSKSDFLILLKSPKLLFG